MPGQHNLVPAKSSNTKNQKSVSVSILKSAGIVTFFTLLSRIMGAVRDLFIANIFGAGMVTDAFIQAFTIPNVFRRLTAEGSMTLAFLPIYTEIREQKSAEEARRFASRVLGLILLGTGLICALGMMSSSQLVWLFAAGFAGDVAKFQLTSDLNRLMFPYLIMVSVVAWSMGILNAEKRFAAPAAAPIFLNLAIIGGAIGLAPWLERPIEGLGWGVLIGGLLQVLLQIPSLLKVKQPLLPKVFWSDQEIMRLLKLLGPSLFGVAVYQINIIILRNLASFLPDGQLTYYYNASRLTEFVLGVFAFAIATASFPELSLQKARTDWLKVEKTLRFSFHTTFLIVFPATAGLIGFAEPIVSILFRHGAFTWLDVQATAITLMLFASSIPAVAAVRLLVAFFYAMQDTKGPVRASLLSMILTGGLGWWLSGIWEVAGLAMALSLGAFGQLITLIWLLHRKQLPLRKFWSLKVLARYFFAAFLIGIGVWRISQQNDWELGPASSTNWLLCMITLVSSGLVYCAIIKLTGDPYLTDVLNKFRKRFKI
ncbi:MAG: murein biosynthesis integral membrane protein MurJ [SAR324 cluster bacterium]|uniref:Probable lipid II flippase MurJ n=1 Tax=SAR324 cluster bacterium TaxID=2024889 RepID=A0A2D6YIW8_9DELT|nr:murein biosynthesis integral membrane protein MurJ [SAR324 cluster bacterium]